MNESQARRLGDQISRLNRLIRSYRSVCADQSARIKDLESENATLSRESDECRRVSRESLSVKERKIAELTAQLTQLNLLLSDSERSLNLARREIESARRTITERDEIIARQQKRIAELAQVASETPEQGRVVAADDQPSRRPSVLRHRYTAGQGESFGYVAVPTVEQPTEAVHNQPVMPIDPHLATVAPLEPQDGLRKQIEILRVEISRLLSELRLVRRDTQP